MTAVDLALPRGIRNNNPGNIRHGNTVWSGQAEHQEDPDFVQFISPEFGIRAIVKIMHSYARIGVNTINGVIHRWAPPNENDTGAYIAAVCQECAIGPDEKVVLDMIMPTLVKAIVRHENGQQPYSDAQIQAGIALA